mmetsp:Transcript_21273/g.54840  ORF Transcript_21273/g.54840 Transcript_21273/m.54840 type:complete len:198 (+) Transcript_21273:262-855(+)
MKEGSWKARFDVVAVLCGIGFAAVGSTGVAIAIIPHALAPFEVDGTGVAIGLIVSAFNFGQLVGGPPVRLAMQHAGLAPLLGVGLTIMLMSAVLMAVAPPLGAAAAERAWATVGLLRSARFAIGIGTVCATNAAMVIMLGSVTSGHGAVMALLELCTGLGSTLGPIIAAGVFTFAGASAAFLVSAVFIVLNMPAPRA